jgi:hypothetical protein
MLCAGLEVASERVSKDPLRDDAGSLGRLEIRSGIKSSRTCCFRGWGIGCHP